MRRSRIILLDPKPKSQPFFYSKYIIFSKDAIFDSKDVFSSKNSIFDSKDVFYSKEAIFGSKDFIKLGLN